MHAVASHILRYPKLVALLLCCGLAYLLFSTGVMEVFGEALNGYGYASIFIAGLLFSFGFTSPFAIGLLLAMGHNVHPVLGAAVGGAGALLADLFIFEFIRFSFHDEIKLLRSTRFFLWLHGILHHERFPEHLRTYVLWSFAGIIIASPLPDELGISLISSVAEVDAKRFGIFCFLINSTAIFLLLAAGRGIVS